MRELLLLWSGLLLVAGLGTALADQRPKPQDQAMQPAGEAAMPARESAAPDFAALDVDGDARVSLTEAQVDARLAQRFGMADGDSDGYLTREEFDASARGEVPAPGLPAQSPSEAPDPSMRAYERADQNAQFLREQTATLSPAEVTGKTIIDVEGEEIGEVERVISDPMGRGELAVVSAGGLFGIGAREVTIPLADLQAGAEGELRASMTKDELLESAGEYEEAE